MLEIKIKKDPPGDQKFNLNYLQSISLQNVLTKSIFIMEAYLSVDWLRFYLFLFYYFVSNFLAIGEVQESLLLNYINVNLST